jgi:hypothetical protein
MKSKCVPIVVVFLLGLAAAQVQSGGEVQPSRAEVYVLEGLGALPGVAGCGCLGLCFAYAGLAMWWGNDNPGQDGGSAAVAYSLALVSAAASPAAAAYGTFRVGEALGERRSVVGAVLGAYAGLPLAVGAIALGVRIMNDPHAPDLPGVAVPLYVLGALAIPVGSVVGYNMGTRGEPGTSRPGLGGRLELPAIALAGTELPDHSVEYGVKVQVAGLRF